MNRSLQFDKDSKYKKCFINESISEEKHRSSDSGGLSDESDAVKNHNVEIMEVY